ncbi:MAG TPA: diaminopimelate decarboxylase [Elusimicrobiota bacterium]|nr:diaminopimelate decarboxylase [Elusimicrobiota bacterium]
MKTGYGTYHYDGGELWVEGVPLRTLAERLGTPLYVYSASKIRTQYRNFDRVFAGRSRTVCYAMKANSNLAVLRLLAEEGAGADIVSVGELVRARRAGIPPHRIVFSGVGKTETEIVAAIRAGILMFNVESAEELEAIEAAARRLRRPAPVSLRVNPNVSVDTHHHIATGKAENKFGVPYEKAVELYRYAARKPWLNIVGIQAHIGSQILEVRPYLETAKKLLSLVDRLQSHGIYLHVLDLGGGLGVPYHGEKPPAPADLARRLLPMMKGRNLRLVFEPGRFLVAESGCLLTRVLYRKETAHKNFVVVDAAMNDLARPALYDAYHPVWPVRRSSIRGVATDVVGPVCESGDYLAKGRVLPRPHAGDFLAVLGAGAYGFSMSSQYNSRPRAAEVLVFGSQWWVVRERETLNDLVRGEKIPPALK